MEPAAVYQLRPSSTAYARRWMLARVATTTKVTTFARWDHLNAPLLRILRAFVRLVMLLLLTMHLQILATVSQPSSKIR